MMFGFFLIPLAIIGTILFVLGWKPQLPQTKPPDTGQTPLEILKARYARGEMTREEFEQARKVLES